MQIFRRVFSGYADYKFFAPFFLFLIMLFPVQQTTAHEVYVLDADEMTHALAMPTPDFLSTIQSHLTQFVEWGSIVMLLIVLVFIISIARPIERLLQKPLIRLKRYAPIITQVTLGLGMLASGFYGSAFGIELPFLSIGHPALIQALFVLSGCMIFFGLYPRLGAVITIGLFVPLILEYQVYMLNYMTYFGEALAILLFGSAYSILHKLPGRHFLESKLIHGWHKYKFLLLRIFFGFSLIYASLYAKFFHGEMALATVAKYNLTHYFPFDPLFLVLGAMILEILIGVFIIVGFEIRFASLFMLVFLCMSMSFFGEQVWPHVILIGTAMAMFTHGYDKYTLSAYLTKRTDLEPTF